MAQAADRYLTRKARKRTVAADRRQLELLKAEFGEETPLAEITASCISVYKAKRLAAVRKIGQGEAGLRTAVSRLEGLTSSQPASVSPQGSAQEPVEPVGVFQKSSK